MFFVQVFNSHIIAKYFSYQTILIVPLLDAFIHLTSCHIITFRGILGRYLTHRSE